MRQLKLRGKRPNKCAVGVATKVRGHVEKDYWDYQRRYQIKMGGKVTLDITYLKSAISANLLDTCKRTVRRLGMVIVESTHMLSQIQEEITRKAFQIKVGLLGIAVHHNSERESTAKMAQMTIVVSIIRQ
jgi:hypothetical protein